MITYFDYQSLSKAINDIITHTTFFHSDLSFNTIFFIICILIPTLLLSIKFVFYVLNRIIQTIKNSHILHMVNSREEEETSSTDRMPSPGNNEDEGRYNSHSNITHGTHSVTTQNDPSQASQTTNTAAGAIAGAIGAVTIHGHSTTTIHVVAGAISGAIIANQGNNNNNGSNNNGNNGNNGSNNNGNNGSNNNGNNGSNNNGNNGSNNNGNNGSNNNGNNGNNG
jgi:hypothetical protein